LRQTSLRSGWYTLRWPRLVQFEVAAGALSLGIRFAVAGSRPVLMSIIYVVAYFIVIEMMVDYDRPNNGFVTVSLSALTDELQSMQHSP
ncbi:MAG: hypothetical protein WBE30_11520, partial [Candidatus Cybelea sp.]